MLSKDEIIALVAKEHNILISRDDPILSLLAVHQVLINQYAKSIGAEAESANQSLTQSLFDAQEKYQNQSKELANQVIGKAVNEFMAAEKRLASKLQEFELAKNPYQKRFNRLELWLICCAILSLGCLLLVIIK